MEWRALCCWKRALPKPQASEPVAEQGGLSGISMQSCWAQRDTVIQHRIGSAAATREVVSAGCKLPACCNRASKEGAGCCHNHQEGWGPGC